MSARTGFVDESDSGDATSEPGPAGDPEGDVGDGISTQRSSGWWRRIDRAWIFPAVVLALLVLLTVAGVNGSSLGELSGIPGGDSSVIAGNPRSVRSDEYYVRTPIVAGQAQRGFPSRTELGVGEHDLTVLVDLPTRDWAMLFRPHQWAYGVLSLDRAFAFEWWSLSAVLLLGTYGFLLVLTRRWTWSTVGAVAFWASPFFHWWYLTLSLAVAGYALAGFALLLASFRDDLGPRRRWLLVGAAAYVLSCFALTFYPPFQVPLVIVVAAASVGFAVQQIQRGAVGWRQAVISTAVAGAVTGVVAGLFVLTRMDTLSAIMNTAYPGSRRVDGGGASSGYLASAWFGLDYILDPEKMRGTVQANESEASSFLLLGCFLLPALPLLWNRIVGADRLLKGVLIGSLAGMGLVGAHMYLSLPGLVAKVTLLDRVTPQRAVIGLGAASLLVAVSVGVLLERASVQVTWRRRVACGALTVVVAGGYVLTLGSQLRETGAPVGRDSILVAIAAAALVVGSYFWKPLVGLGALAVCGLVVSVPVNPLTNGLDGITEAPLTVAVERIEAESGDDPGAWLNTIDMSVPALAAAGVDDVSAVNLYPDRDAWLLLDPDASDDELWNRYAHTRWTLDPASAAPTFSLLTGDTLAITIDPCGPELDALDVRHVVTRAPVDADCMVLVEQTQALGGGPALIYRRTASTG